MVIFKLLAQFPVNQLTCPVVSCLILSNLLLSLIMWMIVSSLLSHYLHLLFCCVLSILALMELILLYIDLRPRQTCHSKDGGSVYSIGVGELGWQYGTGLKSHGTVTDWCTGREWHVNCMTVISAWWRSNMPFQRRRKCIFRWPVMGRYWVGVNCYITQCIGNSTSLGIRRVGEMML